MIYNWNNSKISFSKLDKLLYVAFPFFNKAWTKSYNIINTESNLGHKVWTNPFIWDTLPEYFIVTDPDLEYNDELPVNFIDILYEISNLYNIPKTGFALNIQSPDIFDQSDYAEGRYNIKQWESRFWNKPIGKYKNLDLYEADIDTTFFLGRKSKFSNDYYTNTRNIRVASNFTCKHLPWHIEHNNSLNTPLEIFYNKLESFKNDKILKKP